MDDSKPFYRRLWVERFNSFITITEKNIKEVAKRFNGRVVDGDKILLTMQPWMDTYAELHIGDMIGVRTIPSSKMSPDIVVMRSNRCE